MDPDIIVDTAPASAAMRAIWSDQIPFSLSTGINNTAKDVQTRQRAHQRSIFEVRRPSFVDRAVKIKPFAKKRSLAARIMVDPPGGQARADVIGKFERNREKRPFSGSRLAIPSDNVPRTAGGIIKKRWRPRNFKLRPHGRGSRVLPGKGHAVMVGDPKIVAFFKPSGRGGIFERDGPDLVHLYTFVARVPIRPNLQFVANARRVAGQVWEVNFTRAFKRAVNTATTSGPNVGRLLSAFGGIGR